MQQITITRKFTFDAGHRVYGHESKCKSIHGHTYHVELECSAQQLDNLGRVIDFSVIKAIVGTWIDDNLDHALILNYEDPLVDLMRNINNPSDKNQNYELFKLIGIQKFYVMGSNPTAENIAKHIADCNSLHLLKLGIQIESVTVHETPNCKAIFKPLQMNEFKIQDKIECEDGC